MEGVPPTLATEAPRGASDAERATGVDGTAGADGSSDELFCPGCGYDLRAIGSERCPECGMAIDRERLAESRIPWSHRRRIGRKRAYWRTVWMATFQTRRLAAEMARPADYRDAQRFRLVTVTIATLSVVGVLVGVVLAEGGWDKVTRDASVLPLVYYSTGTPPPGLYDISYPWVAGATLLPVVPLGVLVFVLMVTGVASYWFHPESLSVQRQNRAVALSYYACAPLAFLPLFAIGFGVILWIAETDWDGRMRWAAFLLLVLATHAVLLVIGVAFYVATLRLLRGTTMAGAGQTALAALFIPLTWLLSAIVGLFAVPWVIGYVRLVVDSLR